MTPPHGCGKSQGGGRPESSCSLPLSANPAYFWSVPVWAAVAPQRPRPVVPRFNDSFRNRPDAICQRAGDSMQCSCLCAFKMTRAPAHRQPALPTHSPPLASQAGNPAVGSVRRKRRTDRRTLGVESPWITLHTSRRPSRSLRSSPLKRPQLTHLSYSAWSVARAGQATLRAALSTHRTPLRPASVVACGAPSGRQGPSTRDCEGVPPRMQPCP